MHPFHPPPHFRSPGPSWFVFAAFMQARSGTGNSSPRCIRSVRHPHFRSPGASWSVPVSFVALPLGASFLVFASFVALPFVAPRAAAAQASGTALEWTRGDGAEDCIGADTLRAEVEARLGRSVFAAGSPLVVLGRIAGVDRGFRVEIALSFRGTVVGRRVLESDRARCRALDDSLALMIALLVETADEAVAEAGLAPASSVREAAPTPGEPRPIHVPRLDESALMRDAADPPAGSAPSVAMGVGAWLAADALPGLCAAMHAALELLFDPLSLRIEGAYVPESGLSITEGRLARLALGWGGLSACLDAVVIPWLGLGGCAGLRGGALTGAGLGFEVSRQGVMPWLAITASARARLFAFEPLAVEIAIGLEVPLLRDRFVVELAEAQRVVHQIPPVAPFLELTVLLLAR